MNSLVQALIFLIQTISGFLAALLLLRFYMQVFRVSFNNPLGQIVLPLTSWLVMPIRRLIPSILGFDTASFLLAFSVKLAEQTAIFLLLNFPLNVYLAKYAAIAFLRQHLYLLIFALIVQAILSWVAPFSPIREPIFRLTAPLLNPIRRILPKTGMLDLSPFILLILLQALLIAL